MNAAGAREALEAALRRAMADARKCTHPGDCPSCAGGIAITMTQADIYAENLAAEHADKAVASWRLRLAAMEHSPKGGRAS